MMVCGPRAAQQVAGDALALVEQLEVRSVMRPRNH